MVIEQKPSQLTAVIVFAAFLGAVEVAIADELIGALTGHAAALTAVGMLTSLAFAATVTALGRVLGGRRHQPQHAHLPRRQPRAAAEERGHRSPGTSPTSADMRPASLGVLAAWAGGGC